MGKFQTKYEVTEITLLSIEEYKQYKPLIPCIDDFWWLRSPGFKSFLAAIVYGDGTIDHSTYVNISYIHVRPALRINVPYSSVFQPKDKIFLLDCCWTVLDVTGNQIYILADDTIGQRRFDSESNDWKSSEMKAWLENWLLELTERKTPLAKVRDQIIDELINACNEKCGFYSEESKPLTREMLLEVAAEMKKSERILTKI